jgi:hypothetical protein
VESDLDMFWVRKALNSMLKVYGGVVWSRKLGVELRAVVLARSRAAVREAMTKVGFQVSKNEIGTHWSISANGRDVASTSLAGEGKVLVRLSTDHNASYRGARKADT